MKPEKHKHYTEELRKSSAQLAVDSDHPICKTASDLGINVTTLYSWVSKYNPNHKQVTTDASLESEELKRLRKENALLKQERDILKKAIGIFSVSDKKNIGL